MLLLSALVLGWESSVHWIVKDGCEDNSTIIFDAGLLHSDESACTEVAWTPPGWDNASTVYAWGQCGSRGVEFGFGATEAECRRSIDGLDGVSRLVVVDNVHPGRCVCHLQNDDPLEYDTFTCIETTTTTSPEYIAAESQEDAPQPHTSDSTGAGLIILFSFFFCLLFVGLIWSMGW